MKVQRLVSLLVAGLALWAVLITSSQFNSQASNPAEVDFEQSTWPMRNFGTKSMTDEARQNLSFKDVWFARKGACSGMNSAVMANYFQRKRDSNAPGLHEVASKLGTDGARALAARAQSYSAWDFAKLRGKKGTAEEAYQQIVSALQRTNEPQVIELRGPGPDHQLTILNRPPVQMGDDIRYEIYDVNTLNDLKGSRFAAYFHYNTKQKAFYIEWDDPPGAHPYRDLNELYYISPEELEELFKALEELINDAADGTLDGATGSAANPGGVVLTTKVRPPQSFQLKHLGLSDEGKIIASDGTRSLDVKVDPATLAVALQGVVLLQQSPWLSIGSEQSNSIGKMKVSYGGFIKKTPMGRTLLEADLKLKGLLVGIGLGRGGSPVPGVQDFLWSFPRSLSASALRLWVTGTEFVIDTDGSSLIPRTHGLKLRYELLLRGKTTEDAELDRFVSQFNERWSEIAERIPEFKRLEDAAFATAIAQWVRESDATVDEDLIAYPFQAQSSPDYVPAVCSIGDNTPVAAEGGIGLSGDPPYLGLGGLMGLGASYLLSAYFGYKVSSGFLILLGTLLLSLLPVPWLARLAGGPEPYSRRLRNAFVRWILALGILALLSLIVSEVLFAILGDFDSEFLSLILILIVPFQVIRLLLSGPVGTLRAKWRFAGTTALALFALVAVTASVIAVQTFILTRAAGRITPATALTCRLLSSPINVALRPFFTVTLFDSINGQPASLLHSTLWRYELPGKEEQPAETDVVELPSLFGSSGPPGTLVPYYEIQRGQTQFAARERVYTTDPNRQPPY